MVSISLCMIVKDEEVVLARCLESVCKLVDEIIIVDTGSTDCTKQIAARYTTAIYDFKWQYDFSAARNFAFSKATKEYIMWMDADDVILEKDKILFGILKSRLLPEIDIVKMRYDLTDINSDKIVASLDRERIVKRKKNYKWVSPVHEYIDCQGEELKSDVAITHKRAHLPTKRNLDIFERYIAAGNELEPRNWFYYARELFVWEEIDKAIVYYDKFLSTDEAMESKYLDSCIELAQCYRKKNEEDKILATLLRFFEKTGPRAEICCTLGAYFKERGEYEKAISWFKMAPYTSQTENTGKVTYSYLGYIPYMELCACSFKLGRIDDAIRYNEEAAKYEPLDEKILQNRCFLANVKLQSTQR